MRPFDRTVACQVTDKRSLNVNDIPVTGCISQHIGLMINGCPIRNQSPFQFTIRSQQSGIIQNMRDHFIRRIQNISGRHCPTKQFRLQTDGSTGRHGIPKVRH